MATNEDNAISEEDINIVDEYLLACFLQLPTDSQLHARGKYAQGALNRMKDEIRRLRAGLDDQLNVNKAVFQELTTARERLVSLRAENEELKKDRGDLINVVVDEYSKEQIEAWAQLGKAVEAMENFWILEKLPGPNGQGIEPLWHVYKGTTNFQNDIQASESCASPLEALNKAKEER